MTEEDTNRLIKRKLNTLDNETLEFAKAANDCSIVMATHHSEGIGELKGSLSHGTIIEDKTLRQEYDLLVEKYNKFKRKLLRCSCR